MFISPKDQLFLSYLLLFTQMKRPQTKTFSITSFLFIFFLFTFQLVFFDQRVVRIPEAVINLFHDRVKVLDLTNNKINDLYALQYFPNMEELIIDNNLITEDVTFPPNSPNLRVLSLNNNRVSQKTNLLLRRLIGYFSFVVGLFVHQHSAFFY